MPIDQSFSPGEYCGLFHFIFWFYGSWINVVVDDFLPVDANNELIYSRNIKNKNEFWIPLIEKAYAKLNGCYAVLKSIQLDHCFVDLTSCIVEVLNLNRLLREQKTLNSIRKNTNTIIQMLRKSKINGSINIALQSKNSDSTKSTNELFEITNLNENSKIIIFVNLRPNEEVKPIKSTDALNDDDNEPEDMRKCLPFQDFLEKFEKIHMIHLSLLNLKFSSKSKIKQDRWDYKQMFGKWPKCKDAKVDMSLMPQHILNLRRTQDSERSMIISLMALDYKEKKSMGKGLTPIAFHLFKLVKHSKAVSLTFSKQNYEMKELRRVGKSGEQLVCEREVSKRFLVNRGCYVVIPFTVNNQVETQYLLRVLTENIKKTSMLNESDESDESDQENGNRKQNNNESNDEEIDEPEEFELIDDNESENYSLFSFYPEYKQKLLDRSIYKKLFILF